MVRDWLWTEAPLQERGIVKADETEYFMNPPLSMERLCKFNQVVQPALPHTPHGWTGLGQLSWAIIPNLFYSQTVEFPNETTHAGAAGLETRGAGDLEGAGMVEMHRGQPCCDSVNADVQLCL